MKQREDLTGRTFQQLEVLGPALDYVAPNGHKESMWRCKCLLCGREIVTRGRNLKSGHIKSCGRKHRIAEDLTGQKFGKLTVLVREENTYGPDGTSYVMWRCRCDCGREVVVRASSLKNGHTSSCGVCSRSESNMGNGLDDITGQQFGYWTVLGVSRSLVQPNGRRVTLWSCRCKCGEVREIRAGTLKQGLSYSCGCHKTDVLRKKASEGFAESNAEKVVKLYLDSIGVDYEPQYVFSDLRGLSGYPLSYDFAVKVDTVVRLLIECQGVQHYKPVEYFGGVKRFDVQKENDSKKREYAESQGTKLLEIPYWISNEQDIIQLVQNALQGM